MDPDDLEDMDHEEIMNLDPEKLQELFGGTQTYVLYGGPYDGDRNIANNFIPAQPVIVRSPTENGFVVQNSPEHVGEIDPVLNPDNLLGAVLDDHHIYVMLTQFNHLTGEKQSFYAYAGQDLENYMDNIIVGGPSWESATDE
jgi:hypothetical protein